MKTKIRTHRNQPGLKSVYLLASFLSAALWTLAAKADSWATKAPMPTARHGVSAEAINGLIYVVGGYSGSQDTVVQAYDPSSDSWSTKTARPQQGSDKAHGVINGILYEAGGTDCCTDTTRVFAFDPAANGGAGGWTARQAMPTEQTGAASGVIDGKLYLAGGWDGTPTCCPLVNLLRAFDPSAYGGVGSWTTLAPLPTTRETAAGAVVNGIFYVIGGGVGGTVTGTVEAYDPTTDTWSTRTPMPTPRNRAGVAVVNGVIYVIGGWNGSSRLNTVEAYHPATDTWTMHPSMPTARQSLDAVTVGGTIYAIGGNGPGGLLGANEAFTPEDAPAVTECETDLASARQQIQTLEDQLATADGTIQYLTQGNQLLTIQNGLLRSQVNALTGQNAQLQAANAQLATQLNAANQTIQDQQNQIAQLLAQLNVVEQQVQNLAQSFQALFNDPQFQISGATPTQQIANLLAGIGNLNHGQKQALYLNLGGKPGKGK